MIRLTQLEAGRQEVAPLWPEARGIVAAVHFEAAPGAFIHVKLGSAGLLVMHGESVVGISIEEIVRIAQAHEADLTPRVIVSKAPKLPKPTVPPKKVENRPPSIHPGMKS